MDRLALVTHFDHAAFDHSSPSSTRQAKLPVDRLDRTGSNLTDAHGFPMNRLQRIDTSDVFHEFRCDQQETSTRWVSASAEETGRESRRRPHPTVSKTQPKSAEPDPNRRVQQPQNPRSLNLRVDEAIFWPPATITPTNFDQGNHAMNWKQQVLIVSIGCLFAGTSFAQDETKKSGKRQKLLERFDKDGDGKLSPEERALAKQAKKAHILKRFDADGDGKLSPTERDAARKARQNRGQKHASKQQKRQKLLKRFDTDGNGKLSAEERAAAKKARQGKQKKRPEKNLETPESDS